MRLSFVLALVTLAVSAPAFAVQDCSQVKLEGTFATETGSLLGNFKPLVAEGFYAAAGNISPKGYTVAHLTVYDRGGQANCAIEWINPKTNDKEYSIIVEQKPNGDLLIGGDTPAEAEEELTLLIKQ